MKKTYNILLFITMILIILIYIIYNIYIRIDIKKNKGENKNSKEKIISYDLRVGVLSVDNLNPIISNNMNVQNISRLIFEPLINLTYDYKIEPCLAEEWGKIDEKSYLIKLRKNVKWQDGKSFNAEDVIFTINLIKKLENNSMYYKNIEEIIDIKKIDDLTIKIIINKEIENFVYNLIFPIISSNIYTVENFFEESRSIVPIGTGMYYISDINKENIILKNNLEWWQKKKISISELNLKLYENINDEIKDIDNNKIDLLITSKTDINVDRYINNAKWFITKKNNFKFNSSEMLFEDERNLINNKIQKNTEDEIDGIIKRIEEKHNNDNTYFNLFFDKSLIIYSKNLKGEITPNSYNVFYNIENWYREYNKI